MNYSHYSERLAPLIDYIYKIDSDNAKPEYMKILKKARKIALEEKQWDAYLIVCYHTLYLVSGYRYDVEHCINHCADFLRFLTNHADEAIEQSINPHYHKNMVVWSLEYTVNIYSQYPQIDDAKLNSLMKIYADAANKHSNIYSYWRSKLDTAIHNENKTDIKLALDKCIKHRILSNDCFVCHSFRIERAYLALGEIDNAIALRDDIIADRIPKESKNIFTNCSSGTLYEQNINLLISAVCLGMPEIFFNYAEETFDASPVNGDDNVAYLLICAYLGHYEDTERALLYIMGFENDKHFPFTLMLGALCICTYLSGMVSHGYNIKKIPLCRQNSMFHGEDSQECSVSSAIEYFSAIADDIGRRFEKSRKAFDYDRLKNTMEIISHGKTAN